jgi:hypothetical protein
VVIRRALALLGLGALLACNAIIGLEQPSVVDAGDDVALDAGEQSDAAQTSDAASEMSGQRDGASLADTTSPPFDASDAGDSTVSSDTSSATDSGFGGGDSAMGGGTPPALLYVINAAQLPGIVICVGTGQNLDGSDTTVGPTLPYPQHALSQGCVPLTCADLNKQCGQAGDGCGGVLDCGNCAPQETCGGGGVPGQCGGLPEGGTCQPLTCAQQDALCGPAGDGCGNLIQCGTCTTPLSCIAGSCALPTTGGGLLPGNGQPGPAMDGYENVVTTAFLVPASRVMPGVTCDTLIGPNGQGGSLAPGDFYRAAGSAMIGTFMPGSTTLVAFMGCPPGIGDTSHCGDAFDLDAGNLVALVTTQPSFETFSPGAIQVQSYDLSPELYCGDSGCVPSTTSMSLLWPGNMGGFPLGVYDISMPLLMNGFAQDASSVILSHPAQVPTQLSFDDIARASNDGSTTTVDGAAYFAGGQAYYLVVVGDPNISPDASPNASLHVIGAPVLFQPDPHP